MINVSHLIRNIVFFLILYIPLEELFLKWLPVPDSIFDSLHIVSDFFIVVIFCLYLMAGFFKNKLTIPNLAWVIFLLFSVFSFLMSYATFPGYFTKMWVLMRYIFLYFILINLKISQKELDRFYLLVGFCFCLQIVIGLLQLLDIPVINLFFKAREGTLKIIVPEETIKGTFKFGVLYGFFIMVSFIILYPYIKNPFLKLVLFTTAIIFSYYSGSRLVFLGIVGFIVYMYHRKNKFLIFFTICAFSLFIFMSSMVTEVENIGSLLGLFSIDFWTASLSSGRLGIFNIFPMFFGASVKEILFGFSYDVVGITSFLYQDYNNLSAILRNNAIVGIEDVYWIAFLYYYGILGSLLFANFYFGIMKRMKRLFLISQGSNYSTYIKSIRYLLIFSFLAGFVNQVFYIKTFAFYFWVFAAVSTHPVRFYKS